MGELLVAVSRDFGHHTEEYGEYASWAIWAKNDDYTGGVEGMDDIFPLFQWRYY